jgi:hypothetical protein
VNEDCSGKYGAQDWGILPCWAIIVAAKVEVVGSSPRGIKMPFLGNGSDIRTIEETLRRIRIRYVGDMGDNLKVVFPSPSRFHEYASKGIDNRSTDIMTVFSFIGTFNKDKKSAINDVTAIPIIGDRISLSKKPNSSLTVTCKIEKPGRNKTNRTLIVSERADVPPTKNKTKTRKKPITIGVNFENCEFRRRTESTSATYLSYPYILGAGNN